jgi:hypothetical protein
MNAVRPRNKGEVLVYDAVFAEAVKIRRTKTPYPRPVAGPMAGQAGPLPSEGSGRRTGGMETQGARGLATLGYFLSHLRGDERRSSRNRKGRKSFQLILEKAGFPRRSSSALTFCDTFSLRTSHYLTETHPPLKADN